MQQEEDVRTGASAPSKHDEEGDERRRLLGDDSIPAAGYYTSQPILPYLEHLVRVMIDHRHDCFRTSF